MLKTTLYEAIQKIPDHWHIQYESGSVTTKSECLKGAEEEPWRSCEVWFSIDGENEVDGDGVIEFPSEEKDLLYWFRAP